MNWPDHNLLRVGGGEHVQAGRRKVRSAAGLRICSVLHLLRAGRAGCDCGLESTLRSFYQAAIPTQDLSMSKFAVSSGLFRPTCNNKDSPCFPNAIPGPCQLLVKGYFGFPSTLLTTIW